MQQFILDTSKLDEDSLGPFIFASGTATLGNLEASATALVINQVTATAALDGLISTATSIVENVVTATANLGGLTATATQVTPQPEPSGGGGRNRFDTDRHLVNLRRPKPQPKVEILPEVKFTVIVKGRARTTSKIQAKAESKITFSILDDDAEVLALIQEN